ncbi:cyclin d [Culex quinquefasciatus]|uniref:Cyclin d n=1 Tax=Culex quinquefasciatus TaxID=7176 RepID=B0WTR1_CULQU|nr:cyclin d [Culex quinquefasciatus]|eukprot:XP_001855287.1 cyclin d [Culex quinquefasciatus]
MAQAMDLVCKEIIYDEVDHQFAEPDPTMIADNRVIQNLISLERLTIPPCNYFGTVQQDIKPNMRKIVTTWMLEVCDEQKCEEQTFPLAINFFDRFLCACPIDRYHLQLLGCCALLLASKIRQCHPLTVDVLSAYTDHAVSPDQIRSWELLMISKLEWNITAVTAFDYVDQILERVKWGSDDSRLREHAHTLIHVCSTANELAGLFDTTVKVDKPNSLGSLTLPVESFATQSHLYTLVELTNEGVERADAKPARDMCSSTLTFRPPAF